MQSLIFFGSDQYSAITLRHLLTSQKIKVSLVVTDKPKPQGRKQTVTPNPVEKLANEQKLQVVYYPYRLTPQSDTVGLSASFPHIFPKELIRLFDGRLYNLHPSLLPQYRNVAPVPYAIAMGDQVTGITLFRINESIDSGQIVAQSKEDILPADTTPILLERLFVKGADLFLNPSILPTGSDPEGSLIFTRKLTRASGHIEWPVLLKLINNLPITANETNNPLIKLRLTHRPDRTSNILADMIRALDGYEKVWTIADTKKGKLEFKVLYDISSANYQILIAGKPKSISWNDFTKYYL